jgi:predicted alpha/beta hydrolase family esterase
LNDKYRNWIALAAMCAALSACISPIQYGDIPHSDYVANPRCNPDTAIQKDVAGKPFFAVTSRLPDCRNTSITLTDFRSDRLHYIRHGEPKEQVVSKGKEALITPLVIEAENAWWDQLETEAAKNNGRVMLYVHGFRETFSTTSRDTAQMQRLAEFKGPVIQYSWPSQGELLSYAVDETNMYWSEHVFREFLKKLADKPFVNDIVLVSHSLGARLTLPAIEYVDTNSTRSNANNLSNIILASPDIDTADFERDMAGSLMSPARVNEGRRITIYASANDKALKLSRTIHGYPRLGSPFCFNPFQAVELAARGLPERCYVTNVKFAVSKGKPSLVVIDTSDVSEGQSGHSNHLRSAAVCQDFASEINGGFGGKGNRKETHLPHVFTLSAYPKKAKPDHKAACKFLK